MGRFVRVERSSRWRLYLLLGVAVLLLCQVSGYRAVVELRDVWRQKRDLEQNIKTLRQENAQIERVIQDLAAGGSEIERIARQELGWARPGEIIVKIPEKK